MVKLGGNWLWCFGPAVKCRPPWSNSVVQLRIYVCAVYAQNARLTFARIANPSAAEFPSTISALFREIRESVRIYQFVDPDRISDFVSGFLFN
jgi:hypothetical protein